MKKALAPLLTLAVAALASALAHQGATIHLPFLVLVLGSGVLGFFEPRRGWIWVLILSILVVLGHVGWVASGQAIRDADTARFASFVAPFPALVGGLLGRLSRNIL